VKERMKTDLGWRVLLAGVIILFTPLLIFCGCAKKQVVKQEIPAGASQAPEVSGEAKGEAERLPGEGELGEESLKGEGLISKVQEQLLDINFEFDQFTLTDTAREKLAKNASILSKYSDVKILIEGHCDERGTEEYNLALGERRAESAKQYLVTLGISASRISTISYGEEKPLDPGHNEVAWAKNRRAHFVVSAK